MLAIEKSIQEWKRKLLAEIILEKAKTVEMPLMLKTAMQ